MQRPLLILCLITSTALKPMEQQPSLNKIDITLIGKADAKEIQDVVNVTRIDRVDATNTDGRTRLHWAVYFQDLGMIKDLLTLGANPNAMNTAGATPLHFAAYFYTDQKSPAIIEALLEAGANPDFRGRNIQTPLQLMMVKYLEKRTPPAFQALKSFIARSKELDIQDQRGNTLLYLLIAPLQNTQESQDEYKAIETLLARKANPNIQNRDGFTPLHAAIAQQNITIVKLLLTYGADPYLHSFKPQTHTEILEGALRLNDKNAFHLASSIKATLPEAEQGKLLEIEKLLNDPTLVKPLTGPTVPLPVAPALEDQKPAGSQLINALDQLTADLQPLIKKD